MHRGERVAVELEAVQRAAQMPPGWDRRFLVGPGRGSRFRSCLHRDGRAAQGLGRDSFAFGHLCGGVFSAGLGIRGGAPASLLRHMCKLVAEQG